MASTQTPQDLEAAVLDIFKTVLETSGASPEDKAFVIAGALVIAGTWTLDQLPEIRDRETYDLYARNQAAIDAIISHLRLDELARSRVGMFSFALAARMIEWGGV